MAKSSREKSVWTRAVGVVVLLGALGWASITLWGGGETRPPLNTVRVERGDIEETVTATGQLHPVLNVEVGSQVSGIIAEIFADFNSDVKEGEVLARLDTSTFEANMQEAQGEVDSAAAALELARIEANRMEQLKQRELIPQSELDQARAKLRQAEATLKIRTHGLERAQSELARCTIYSPIDGVVISRAVDVGQTVAASMTAPVLFTIANDLTRMRIHSHVPEADIGDVRAGQRVEFAVDAFPQTFTGTVWQVRNAPIVQQHVVMYDTVIDVDNPDRLLKPGMTATVSIVTDDKLDVLRVRNTALRARLPDAIRPADPEYPEEDDRPGLWRTAYRLVGGDPAGAIEAVAVRTGLTDGAWTEVHEGVAEGDVLVTGIDLSTRHNGGRNGGLFGPGPAQF